MVEVNDSTYSPDITYTSMHTSLLFWLIKHILLVLIGLYLCLHCIEIQFASVIYVDNVSRNSIIAVNVINII